MSASEIKRSRGSRGQESFTFHLLGVVWGGCVVGWCFGGVVSGSKKKKGNRCNGPVGKYTSLERN